MTIILLKLSLRAIKNTVTVSVTLENHSKMNKRRLRAYSSRRP
jgi:hypothetical protein